MSIKKLPLYDSTFIQYQVLLGLEKFTLIFRYLERPDSWYLSILQSDGTPIVQGSKIMSSFPVFKGTIGLPGSITPIDVDETGFEPSFDFPDKFSLLYSDDEDEIIFGRQGETYTLSRAV